MLLFLVAFVGGAGLTWVCNALELIPWRRAQDAHWAERARIIHPARVAAVMNEWAIPLLAVVVGINLGLGERWLALLMGAYFGGLAGGWSVSKALVPALTVREWIRISAAHVVMRGLGWGIFAAALYWMPGEFNGVAVALATGYVAIRLGLLFGLYLRIMRMIGILVPAGERVRRLAAETAAEAGVRVRATWELRFPVANAFAAVTTQELVFTSALVESAPDDELCAICRHELAHLAESRWLLFSRLIGDLVVVPLIFARPVFTAWGALGLSLLAGSCGLLWLLRPMLVQALERRADRQAVSATPDASAYARVLERIHRINLMPAVLSNNALNTHPNLYDRMLAANVTPDFPRPAAASGNSAAANVIIALLLGLIAWAQVRG